MLSLPSIQLGLTHTCQRSKQRNCIRRVYRFFQARPCGLAVKLDGIVTQIAATSLSFWSMIKPYRHLSRDITSFENLLVAFHKGARGKRGNRSMAGVGAHMRITRPGTYTTDWPAGKISVHYLVPDFVSACRRRLSRSVFDTGCH